jgi:hypothetical protein
MFPERARVQIVLASAIVGLTMLFGRTAAADAFQTNCSGGSIGNKNGPVMTGPVNVYLIWYGGKNAQQFGGFESQVVTYLNALSESSYMAMNTTYNQNQTLSQPYENVLGSFSVQGEVTDNVSQGEGTLIDSQIQAIVQNAIYGGDVDANTGAQKSLPLDSNGVYFVFLPSQVVVGPPSPAQPFTNAGPICGASTGCAYHTSTNIYVQGQNNWHADIKYAVIGEPDQFCSTCQWGKGATQTPTNKVFDAKVNALTHELEETLTDPDHSAWTGSGGESADLCAWAVGSTFAAPNGGKANLVLNGQPYLIQMEWVNENGGYGANGYGLPFGNGLNSGFEGSYGAGAGDPLGDWSFGNFKAQCSPGQPVIGISESIGETGVHSILCGNGGDYANYPQIPQNLSSTGCHDLPFNPTSNLAANPEGDWAFGSVKAECGLNEYVAGISRAPTNPPAAGQIDSILCCPGSVTHRQCENVELFYGQNSRDYTPPDWDYGYYKGQCLPGKYVAGVAAVSVVPFEVIGAADILLCCLP